MISPKGLPHNLLTNINKPASELAKASERMSSGLRINSAKDDAAGLAIAQRIFSQVQGMNVAYRNASDAHSLLQTADGGLASATDTLQRMRELALQAGNGTYSESDRQALQNEFSSLQDELARVGRATSFNSQPLLDGSTVDRQFQIGADAGQTVQVSISGGDPVGARAVADLDVTDTAAMEATLAAIDDALSQVTGLRAELGAVHNRVQSIANDLAQSGISAESTRSRIEDADFAQESSARVRALILQESSMAMLAHDSDRLRGLSSLLES